MVSIGTLAAHPLWGERAPARTGHATTSLITVGDDRILVDPGLPAPALVARLAERANLTPADITHVFLTSFRPDARRALEAFPDAEWLMSDAEREAIGVPLVQRLKHLASRDDDPESPDPSGPEGAPDERRAITQDIALLQRTRPAPDRLAPHVALFPLPGVTPGLCGLILEDSRHTIVICGDAIPTIEHLEQGKVLPNAADLDRARESLRDAIEVADLLVLGRDNIAVNPTRRPF